MVVLFSPTWTVIGLLEKEETETHDGSPPDVVVNVADGNVQELADGLVVTGSAVGHGDCIHSRPVDTDNFYELGKFLGTRKMK